MTELNPPLFEPDFVRVLESLTLAGRRVPAGKAAGQWRSRASGSSVEFSDYRTYAPGDEFRRIDWNAYARLERLFVRLYRAEEDLSLALLLDTSASMAFGKPPKGRFAARLAGALTFVALRSGDRVDIQICRDAAVDERLPDLRGRPAVWPAWRLLERLEFGGATNLNVGLAAAAGHLRGSGVSVVISDLFSPAGYQQGVDALLARRQDVVLVHVLAAEEINPPPDLVGEWRLLDSEQLPPLDASISPGVVSAYRRLLASYIREAAEFCRRRGVTYLQLRSDVSLQDIMLRTLRTVGIVV